MMLYGGDVIESWRAGGAPGDFPVQLAGDVREARRLFELRVPEELRGGCDYFGDALRAVLHGAPASSEGGYE
jgi:hypothetical protein